MKKRHIKKLAKKAAKKFKEKGIEEATTVDDVQKYLGKDMKINCTAIFDNDDDWDEEEEEEVVAEPFSHEQSILSITGAQYGNVNIGESHGCCAKAYMWGFGGHGKVTSAFLKLGEIYSKKHGYTNIGLTHLKDSPVVEEALKQGWKVLREFQNKRTGNDLVELTKDL